ncbi:MAG: amidophosphoribosyltransferase [Clostridiaceae bacterium]|jgi:amidophosphoribosyltransferase|nr:amidophosphoribosyltransferase [Clostridiaceae bacterium]
MTSDKTSCFQNKRFDKLHEECAVFGVSTSTNEAPGITYNGLLALQHRGQEGAGIAVLKGRTIVCHKDVGLTSEVFSGKILQKLPPSTLAVGHTRYSTTGTNTQSNVQPFVTEYLTGRIATAHNGNILNAWELKATLIEDGLDFIATSDSEVISSLIAHCIIKKGSVSAGVAEAARKLDGAFSLIIMTGDGQLVAVRDPRGFRPLCIGLNDTGMAVASESCALDSCGFTFLRDVAPGELVVIQDGEIKDSFVYAECDSKALCIFEYVYFARSDSVIDGLSVYEARYNMGRALAASHYVEADAVCGVPDSGLDAAKGYADASGLPYVTGFVKNRYIGRSFIFPSQAQRENAVRLKLNPLKSAVAGKRIVLIDDSIVRGTTCAKIIATLKAAGAKEVHLRISSPPFKHTCHFGTDIDGEENLIANKKTVEEIRQIIGADSLGYIGIKDLRGACKKANLEFCTGCFDGNYGYKGRESIETIRKDILEREKAACEKLQDK